MSHLNELLKQEHVIADAYRAELEKAKVNLEKAVSRAQAEGRSKVGTDSLLPASDGDVD